MTALFWSLFIAGPLTKNARSQAGVREDSRTASAFRSSACPGLPRAERAARGLGRTLVYEGSLDDRFRGPQTGAGVARSVISGGRGLRLGVAGDVAGAARVDLHARTHGRRHDDGAQVAPLRRRRTRPDELLDDRRV